MKRFKIFLEDAEQDLRYREAAHKVYYRILNVLSNKAQIAKYVTVEEGEMYDIFLDKIKGIKDLKDVVVVLAKKRDKTQGSITRVEIKNRPNINHIISLYILPDNWVIDYVMPSPAKLSRIFKENRDTAIHEIIHYFDIRRWKGGVDDFYRAIDKNADDKKKYFNSPRELNAFYQEMMSTLEDQFSRYTSQEKAAVVQRMRKEEQFLLTFMKKIAPSFKYLNQKNQKKFLKRAMMSMQGIEDTLSQGITKYDKWNYSIDKPKKMKSFRNK